MINKEKNVNLQLTISKNANDKLAEIQSDLVKIYGLRLSKSQAVEYLINKYELETLKNRYADIMNGENKSQAKQETSAKINALKDALSVSFTQLSEIIDIPLTTLKKYAYGKQEPSGENKQKLARALKKYGIK